MTTMATDDDNDKASDAIASFVELLQRPEDDLLSLLQQGKNSDPASLRTLCASLFQQVESYHAILQRTRKKKGIAALPSSTLAGLEELYMGEGGDNVIDAETLWGQVDLQNEALRTLLRKQVKKLSVSTDAIQLLDLGQVLSEDEREDEDSEEDDDDDSDEEEKLDEELDNDEEVDDETKRIRARMARTMDDMDDDMDDDDDDDASEEKPAKKEEEDPDREKMLDGFFDLHEMEAFADEEEEFLPDDAYGEAQGDDDDDDEEKKSFHQRQRDGDLDSGSEEDDDDALAFNQPLVRRKKYRPDDEVDALFTIYEKPKDDQGDNDDDVINMTSADFFGKPNMKAMKQWEKEHQDDIDEMDKGGNDDDDADSWDNHDFGGDQASGWRDEEDDDGDERRQHNDDDDDEEENGEEEEESSPKGPQKPLSKSAKQTQRLLQQTKDLEQEMLAEKPWHMIGEAKGMSRPMNSLIESTPQFQTATKVAPIITVEHTTNIEEIIKRRILNEDWDNVVPRELPDVGWNQKRGELPEVSQEKSKLGLGELYEREYLKKSVGYDVDAVEKETEETKAKDEMKALFASLCSKLDALSNYHFAPRPIAEEAEVRAISTPAIAMEEILPLHVSGARGVAPEEVYGAKNGRDSILRGDSELTQAERKRLRNSKKSARRKVRKEKLADEKLISKLQPSGVGLSNPYEKRKMREELQLARSRGKVTTGKEDKNSDYGASSQFFQRLQSEIQEGVGVGDKRKRPDDGSNAKSKKSSAYKL